MSRSEPTHRIGRAQGRRQAAAARRRQGARHRPGDLSGRPRAAGHGAREDPAQPARACAHPRASIPRAREALKGVLAVVTAADFPELPVGATIPMGETGYDMWMVARINMARDKVHWVGQPVAAVAAVDVTRGRSRAGADRGRLRAAAARARHRRRHGARRARAARARLHQGRRAAAARAEQRLLAHGHRAGRCDGARLPTRTRPPRVSVQVDTAHQGYLEPQVVVAQVDANGFATVWASTQGQFTAELMIARMLGLPQSKLKVVPLEIGGGFGGKIAIHGEAVAVRLAQKCRRPVKLVLTREEVLQGGSGPAAGALIDIAVGARQGRPPRRHRGHLSHGCGRAARAEPVAGDAGLGRPLPVPQPQPARFRRRHQQAAHRGLSRAGRHPGGFRHGAGHGRAVPAARHGPAGVPQAQRVGDRQH